MRGGKSPRSPSPHVCLQAANLRFIMEAPKLQRGPDEVVALPVMDSASAVKCALPTDMMHRSASWGRLNGWPALEPGLPRIGVRRLQICLQCARGSAWRFAVLPATDRRSGGCQSSSLH